MNKARNRPLGLLAELTYRCPLHCPYCSNPLMLSSPHEELTLDEWIRVLTEARTLGVVQLHLSGGEPLQRHDLLEISHRHIHLASTRTSLRARSRSRRRKQNN